MGGAAVAGGAAFDTAFIASAFGAVQAVEELAPEAVDRAVAKSNHPEHFPEIERSLGTVGLKRAAEGVKTYRVVGQVSGKPKTVTIIPYHPTDKSKRRVGAVGVTDGSTPSGVHVELEGTKLVSITTHDVMFKKTVTRTIKPEELKSKGPASFVEKRYARDNKTRGEVTVETASELAEKSLRSYLAKEQAAGIYKPDEVKGLLEHVPTVRLIAELQHHRHRGLEMSPGNACCSCCTTCWGCCSCSCAVTSGYLSTKYQSRAAARLRPA